MEIINRKVIIKEGNVLFSRIKMLDDVWDIKDGIRYINGILVSFDTKKYTIKMENISRRIKCNEKQVKEILVEDVQFNFCDVCGLRLDFNHGSCSCASLISFDNNVYCICQQ